MRAFDTLLNRFFPTVFASDPDAEGLDLSDESRAASQAALNGLWTLY